MNGDSRAVGSPENFHIDVGIRVRERRKAMQLSQDGLASIAKISKMTISRIETGKQKMYYETAYILAKALGVGTDYFVTGLSPVEEVSGLQKKLRGLNEKQYRYIEESLRMLTDIVED